MANPNDWGRRSRNEGVYYQAHGTDQQGRPLDHRYPGVEQLPRSPEITAPNTPIGPPVAPYGYGHVNPRNHPRGYLEQASQPYYSTPRESNIVSSSPRTEGLGYGQPPRLDQREYSQQDTFYPESPPEQNYQELQRYRPDPGHPPRSSPPNRPSHYEGDYPVDDAARYTTRTNNYTDSSAAPTPTPQHPFVAPPPPRRAPGLGSRYRRQLDPQNYFTRGTVFAVLWHEEAGDMPHGGTLSFTMTGWGEMVYSEVYRMVVVRWDKKSCVCLPIHTYGKQGYRKPGLTLQTHAPILLLDAPGPEPLPRQMIQDVLRVVPDNDWESLDPRSLINFGAPCTVQHKCKVRPIGKLTPDSLTLLLRNYKECSMREYYD